MCGAPWRLVLSTLFQTCVQRYGLYRRPSPLSASCSFASDEDNDDTAGVVWDTNGIRCVSKSVMCSTSMLVEILLRCFSNWYGGVVERYCTILCEPAERFLTLVLLLLLFQPCFSRAGCGLGFLLMHVVTLFMLDTHRVALLFTFFTMNTACRSPCPLCSLPCELAVALRKRTTTCCCVVRAHCRRVPATSGSGGWCGSARVRFRMRTVLPHGIHHRHQGHSSVKKNRLCTRPCDWTLHNSQESRARQAMRVL